MRTLIILFSIISIALGTFGQEGFLSGLYFSSHEVIQEKRTSLNLTPFGSSKFPGGFSIEMEANFRQGDGHYGYIFRIIGNESTNIDLVSNLASTSSNFWLVLKDKVLFSYKWSDIPNGGFNTWIKIRIDIDTQNSKLSVSFNGNKFEEHTTEIESLKSFNLLFGACRNPLFFSTDISPMSLKNIRIFNSQGKQVRDWKLSRHSKNKVFDEISKEEAQVENPIWIIDKHVKWKNLRKYEFDGVHGITKDEENGRIFFVDNRAVYVLSTLNSKLDTIPFGDGKSRFAMGQQILFNKFTNELWSYDFNNIEISKFSLSTKKWSFNKVSANEPDFWHHNKYISPVDSSLMTLFGYGHYLYKSTMSRYNEKLKIWEINDLNPKIQPRYLSGTGFLNNRELLIFGGYGSKTGRQELSPEFYYDLYSLNMKDNSVKKLWTLDKPKTPFVPCESLIPDQQSGNFYTLLYNSGFYSTFLHLAKFEIGENKFQLYDDSIPYNFLDTKSWSTLFLDRKTSQLIAVTSHDSEVSLYSIAYPPLMPKDAFQSVPVKGKWYVWLTIGLLAVGLFLVFIILYRKKKVNVRKEGLYEQVEHPNIAPIRPVERKTVSSILFMGGFQIFNSKGCNITTAFSPTLKQLFLFIFLHTIKNEKGVSSAKLDEVLWFDKIGESARNNRNVNISKLRSIIEEVEGVEVINENSFWKIKMGKPVFCDYTEILYLLRQSESFILTETEVHELIAFLSFGEFLPLEHTEWMDGFKSQFANETIDRLSSLLNENNIKDNFSLRYHLSECILVYDPLNDEAFAIKCSVLYHLGKKSMAKNLYDSFCREYKKVLGIEYTTLFNDTIK